ncbi:MAG: hypothetical protein KF803_18895 [Cyclobacteriaceae bacterium]|nr:hypothetical protein [Cyclobacteriaceae bacterium]
MKAILAILTLTLLTATTVNKDLKLILKDGHFSKLPRKAKVVGHGVLVNQTKRFGYLIFEASSEDIAKWIRQSNLILTSKTEILDDNIIVWPNNKPTWFKDSSERFMTSDIYYSKREPDKFTSLSWVDIDRKIIHIEYEIGL